jgi:hypothetical protein
MQRVTLRLGLAAVLGLLVVGRAPGAPITYTETVIGSGTFAGTLYTNTLITIIGTGDTANVTQVTPLLYHNSNALVTVTVGSLGRAVFTDPILTVDNQGSPSAGFGDFILNDAVLFSSNPAFATYNLTGPIGPISGTPGVDISAVIPTTLGGFSITSTTGLATFVATVPEPSSLVMMHFGLAAVAGLAWRHRKAKLAA